jgi:hypothetical protein
MGLLKAREGKYKGKHVEARWKLEAYRQFLLFRCF